MLLIGIPAGYLVISAEQSRDSGRDKEAESSATGLRDAWPSQMQRRIFEVPIPAKSTDGRVLRDEQLEDQPAVRAVPYDRPPGSTGSSKASARAAPQLDDGKVTISARDAKTVGWHFGAGRATGRAPATRRRTRAPPRTSPST